MKSIIDGKRYSTRTSEKIASYVSGHSGNDFKWFEESLFKTEKGKYFLSGAGGPLSKYAEDVPTGGISNGSGIIPMSREEAAAWCEYTENFETMESEFIDMVEDA